MQDHAKQDYANMSQDPETASPADSTESTAQPKLPADEIMKKVLANVDSVSREGETLDKDRKLEIRGLMLDGVDVINDFHNYTGPERSYASSIQQQVLDNRIVAVSGANDAKTVSELKDRITLFLELHARKGQFVKLSHLNKKFGIKASKLGSSVRDVVTQLYREARTETLQFDRFSVVLAGPQSEWLNSLKPEEYQSQLRRIEQLAI